MVNYRVATSFGLALVVWHATVQSADTRSAIQSYVDSHQRAIVAELVELVSIPNVGADEENLRRNAVHLRGMLQKRGMRAELIETAGAPLVYGELKVPQATRTLLIWAHYDGQPVDPRAWKQASPFTPVLRDGRLEDGARVLADVRKTEKFDPEWRLYGRSASDNKAPIVAFLAALDALKAAGIAPTSNIRIVLDGEEESGSPSVLAAVGQHREKFLADLMIIMDGTKHPTGRPTVAFGFRGVLTFELTVFGPKVGAASGNYGNWVPNPGARLAHLLASMRNEEGRALVEGFYDGLAPLTPEEQRMLDAVPDDTASLLKTFGIAAPERPGVSLQQALQLPALNVRGLSSAYVGNSSIIPERAVAAIDVRLVKETPAGAMAEKIRAHLRGQGYHVIESEPDDATRARYPRIVKIVMRSGADGYRTAPLGPEAKLVVNAVADMFGEQPVQLRTVGGTAFVAAFIGSAGFPAILLPTVNFDNNQHGENENVRLGDLFSGIRAIAAVLTM